MAVLTSYEEKIKALYEAQEETICKGKRFKVLYGNEWLEGMITYVDCRTDKFQIERFGEYDSGKLDIEGVQEVKDCPRELKRTNNVKIWVDDIRPVPEGYEGTKSVNETKALIEQIEAAGGSIDLIDLDHDLGDYAAYGGDAIKILDYLVERETFYPIAIHTANPVGRANMERMIRRFWP